MVSDTKYIRSCNRFSHIYELGWGTFKIVKLYLLFTYYHLLIESSVELKPVNVHHQWRKTLTLLHLGFRYMLHNTYLGDTAITQWGLVSALA